MKKKFRWPFSWTWWRKYVGFRFLPYTYDGNDGRWVTHWELYLGWFTLRKHRYGYAPTNQPIVEGSVASIPIPMTAGQFYIDELAYHTVPAPWPDHQSPDGLAWFHQGFHKYNTTVARDLIRVLENQLQSRGLKSAIPYPAIPPLPQADLHVNGQNAYLESTLIKHGRMIARSFIAHASAQATQ